MPIDHIPIRLLVIILSPTLLLGCGRGQSTTEQNATTPKTSQTTADLPTGVAPAQNTSPVSKPTAATIPVAYAPPPTEPVVDRETFDSHVRPFFEKHCVGCHGEETAEGELRVDDLAADFIARPAIDHWIEILDRLNLGEMPPQDEPRPDPEALASVVDWITSEMQAARARSQSTGGRVVLRRLTRLEYAHTVRDLLNVEFVEGSGPLDRLPPDGSIAGFDRVSNALLLDPSLMEAYLTVARDVADRAVVFRPPLVAQKTLRFEFDQTPHTAMSYIPLTRDAFVEDDFLVIMESSARSYAKLRHPFNDREIPLTGRYQVRVRAAADPGERGEPIFMDVTYGSEGRQARFRVEARRETPEVYEFEKTFDSFTPGEFNVRIANGSRFRQGNAEWYEGSSELNRLAENGEAFESKRMKSRMRAEGSYDHHVRSSYLPEVMDIEKLPKLYLEWIEVVGPLQGEFPPPSTNTVFGDHEIATRFANPSTDHTQLVSEAKSIFQRLLPRAFRRPVTDAEVQAVADLVAAELEAGASAEEALETGIVAMLCSPDFLYLFEPSSGEQPPRKLSGHELATRLSYFLWSSMPDEQLASLAASGQLDSPTVLAGQVDRMLADSRVEGLVDGFARQWLKVDEISRFPPDEQIYPDFYATDMAGIEADVEREPIAFFREVLLGEEPVSSFLDSDWLMLNERLAKLYGIAGVEGTEIRRVALDRSAGEASARQRGGLLGMAGVHLWGADGNRTKPVDRGKYILTVLFNDPPPPPPPNAGEVEPNLRGERLTVRERLARHREQATCNNCHRRIDPYGLAMENFNVIGQWRELMDGEKPLRHWGDERPPIEPAGQLPSGREFTDFVEFKQAVAEQEERFQRALTEKLFTYALGRPPESGDRPVIDRIVATMQSDDPTLKTLLKQIVLSETFQVK